MRVSPPESLINLILPNSYQVYHIRYQLLECLTDNVSDNAMNHIWPSSEIIMAIYRENTFVIGCHK
jgi:hypothetical protein